MIAEVFGPNDALVVVAIITAFGSILTIIVQKKVQRENRQDHANVTKVLSTLHKGHESLERNIKGVGDDLRDVKADVREIKNEHRSLKQRFERHVDESS